MGHRLPIVKINERIPAQSKLRAVEYVDSHTSRSGIKRSRVICKCICGKEITCVVGDLTRGNPLSCGCSSKKGRRGLYSIGNAKLYKRWYDMRERCYNSKCANYKYYGAKGVKVCNEWLNDYIAFAKWSLKNGYTDDLQLDKDINGDGKLYSPKTCSWVTHLVNARQKESIIKLSYKGKLRTISEIAEMEKISYATLLTRYKKSKDITLAVNYEKTPNYKKYSN